MRATLQLQLEEGDIEVTQTLVDLSMNLPAVKFHEVLARVTAQQLPDFLESVFEDFANKVAEKENKEQSNAKPDKKAKKTPASATD
jgi:hypothetical protein